MPASVRSSSGAPLRVIIAGGGTGGHLYPGIAVARELRRRSPDAQVSFAGTARGLEARVVPQEGFALDCIRSAGLKGKSIVNRARGAALLLPGFADAWRIVSRRRPRVVIGVGGYSSGPVVLVAALRGVPTMVLEQNASPGLTNRWLARVVRAAAVTYEETLTFFPRTGFVAGNPVREEFFADEGTNPHEADEPGAGRAPRVLILGGSQGARAINLAMVAAAPELVRRIPDLVLVHQTGERDRERVRADYAGAGIAARAAAFFDPVAGEMKAADLVVCRAGATTLAELAASGRPAVLIPFPAATDDHQRKNAQVLVQGGAAVLIDERDLSGQRLAETIASLVADAGRRRAMGAAMRAFARRDAAARIADRILELAG
jgi:UDP-N-acetylglucosamine--N-acetylmuramyl-(pentapeptide) pyrophosphoryl-undecaprenol N-acetylglucosamine transferase